MAAVARGFRARVYFCSSFSLTLDSFSRTSLALSSEAQEALLFTVSGRVGKPSLIKKFKNIFDIDRLSLLVNPPRKVFTKPRTIFPWDDS